MSAPLRALSAFARDCFLLARFAEPGQQGRPDGRAWERAVSSLAWQPGLLRRQHAGLTGVFGCGSASGAAHEIDGALHGAGAGVWVEAKARGQLDKSAVAVFELKCSDLYVAQAMTRPAQTAAGAWWPLLVSSEPAGESVRRLCAARGAILCDPLRLPLPVLLHAAGVPEADLRLPESLLREALRLFGPACRTMQQRWRISPGGRELTMSLPSGSAPEAIADTLFVQDELSAALLDVFDEDTPGALERRAGQLAGALWRAQAPPRAA